MNLKLESLIAALIGAFIGSALLYGFAFGVTPNWDNFISALVGGLLAIASAYFAHQWQVSKEKAEEADTLKGVLQAVYDEIETLWNLYMDGVGHEMEALQNGQALNSYYPVTQEYFTVYVSNGVYIGRIKNHDLRKSIVSTYCLARGLIDSYRLNNDLVRKHEHAYWLLQETKNPIHQAAAAAHYRALVDYLDNLKLSHEKTKKSVQDLLRMLSKEGVLSRA